MPALPPVAGTAKIIVKQTLANVNVFNILHATTSDVSTPSAADLAALSVAVRSAWVSSIIPLQSTALLLGDVQCVDLSSATGSEATTTGSTPGTSVPSVLAASSAVCYSWKVSARYRGGHPRTYIAGLVSSDLSNANTLVASRVTSHLTAANSLRAAINAAAAGSGNWIMTSVSYRLNNAPRPSPVARIITGVSVDNRVDSQRRRLGRDR